MWHFVNFEFRHCKPNRTIVFYICVRWQSPQLLLVYVTLIWCTISFYCGQTECFEMFRFCCVNFFCIVVICQAIFMCSPCSPLHSCAVCSHLCSHLAVVFFIKYYSKVVRVHFASCLAETFLESCSFLLLTIDIIMHNCRCLKFVHAQFSVRERE